ncbi:MAG: glycosyltransferase [Clostridiaceae bacterium]|nr:glycosyltransferase [Clostridiaceae bacterium]
MNINRKENPVLSFIVPIYGVERYIRRCVQSIMQQNYRNIEIILVDDGSPDSCGKIIDELSLTDDRITVIHQDNSGVSVARNQGLLIATGEYVLFVDGDDYIEKDYAEYFIGLINTNDVDMGISINNYTVDSDLQVEKDNICIMKETDIIELIYFETINVAVWNKIYKMSILKENNIYFHSDIWYGEGMLFNIEYLQCVDRVAVGERKIYHQIYNPNSAMRKFNLDSNFCGLRSLEVQKSIWKKVTPEIEMAWKYHYRSFSESIICGLVATNAVEKHQDVYKSCISNMKKDMLLPWKVNIPIGRKLRLTLFSIIPHVIALHRKQKAIHAAELQNKQLS